MASNVKRIQITLKLMVILLIAVTMNTQTTCADVDDRVEDKSKIPRTFSSLRSNMTKEGYYCDLAINWPINSASWNNKTRHDSALAAYKAVYAAVTSSSTYPDNLDQDRMAGVNRDCLASLYTILCGSVFPFCDSTNNSSHVERPGLCKATCELLQYRCPTLTDLYNNLCSGEIRETNCATCNLIFSGFLLSIGLSLLFTVFS